MGFFLGLFSFAGCCLPFAVSDTPSLYLAARRGRGRGRGKGSHFLFYNGENRQAWQLESLLPKHYQGRAFYQYQLLVMFLISFFPSLFLSNLGYLHDQPYFPRNARYTFPQ